MTIQDNLIVKTQTLKPDWIQILDLPVSSCVTLSKLPNLS